LRDRSLEVVRMARELAARHPRSPETDWVGELEEPALITLGIVYEQHGRFAGSPYFPVLRKVDRFAGGTLARGLRDREGFAARLVEIDERVKEIVLELKQRGFRSPYLRNLVVARINPVRFHKARKTDAKPPMPLGAALTRMAAAARKFDSATVREQDLALVAALSSEE
jgi:ParB family chromosome partitioning protein